jgi:hypothetical protein
VSFRIGRKHAQHTYPEPRGSAETPFARNFAYSQEGQAQSIPDDAEVAIIWDPISSGAPAGTNVPITPVSTGIVRIIAAVSVRLDAEVVDPSTVTLKIHVNGVEIEPPESFVVTMQPGEFEVVPVLAEVSALPIGVVANIEIFATASEPGASLIEESSSIEVHEVIAATG